MDDIVKSLVDEIYPSVGLRKPDGYSALTVEERHWRRG